MSELECINPSLEPSTSNPQSLSQAKQPTTMISGIIPLIVSLAWVVLTDLLLYQGSSGYVGWAVWLIASNVLIIPAIALVHRTGIQATSLLLFATSGLTAIRLIWQGNSGLIAFAILHLLFLTMSAHGLAIDLKVLMRFTASLIPIGVRSIVATSFSPSSSRTSRGRSLEVVIPLVFCGLFGAVFLMANPEAVQRFVECFSSVRAYCLKWVFSIGSTEPLLWGTIILCGLAAILPSWKKILPSVHQVTIETCVQTNSTTMRSFRMWRNTLVCVSILFMIYLITEFATMWFRQFPEGFYYSGYAHAGAAWLTIALAISTLIISLVFRPALLDQDSYLKLMRWAKFWSLLNFVLAICVFNRLWIYIGYNGMTRMRVVALMGVCCVIVGFGMVLVKALRRRSLSWLLGKQLFAVVAFLFLLAVLPVDYIVYKLNSRRIMMGDLAPAVQITEHSLSDSGLLAILPLLQSDDQIVREGVAAMLANRLRHPGQQPPWQEFQIASWRLESLLESTYTSSLQPWMEDELASQTALQNFKDYVWKWY